MSEHEIDLGEMPALSSAIAALRSEVPVRRQWRESVLREIGTLPTPRRTQLQLVSIGDSARAKTAHRSWRRSHVAAAAAAAAILVMAGVIARRASSPSAPPRIADSRAASATGATHASSAADAPSQGQELFSIAAPGASDVSLVGDFNQWHPGATPLRPAGDGRTWVVQLALPPGRHVYAFVVDGKIVPDPDATRAADDDFGVPSSVAIIAVAN